MDPIIVLYGHRVGHLAETYLYLVKMPSCLLCWFIRLGRCIRSVDGLVLMRSLRSGISSVLRGMGIVGLWGRLDFVVLEVRRVLVFRTVIVAMLGVVLLVRLVRMGFRLVIAIPMLDIRVVLVVRVVVFLDFRAKALAVRLLLID